jgi:MFS family permease
MPTPSTFHPGRLFAAAATLVTAPRLVLAFLVGDGIALPESVRIALLSTSSVATAVALTGGAAYLAHAIAVARRRGLLTALWAAALVCSSALMAPVIAAGLPRSPLAAILPSTAHQWLWAICAVLAVDLVAAGAIRADAEQRRDRDERDDSHRREIAELLAQRDTARAALAALERERASGAPVRSAPSAPEQTGAPRRSAPAAERPALAARVRSSTGAPNRLTSGALPLSCSCGFVAMSQQALAGHRRWCPEARSERSGLTMTATAPSPFVPPDETAPIAST